MLWVRLWRTGFLLFHLIFSLFKYPIDASEDCTMPIKELQQAANKRAFSNLASLSNIVSALVRIFRSGLFGCVCF